MTREEAIKAQASALGFDQARITGPEPPGHGAQVAAWLAAGMQGEMGYLERRAALREGPLSAEELLPGARSLIVVALSYHFPDEKTPATADRPQGIVARYARGEDYHPLMWEKLNALGSFLQREYGSETRCRGFADSGPIRERELAARAGLGWQGKHTNLISLDLGNWFFLGALLTTLPLATDDAVAAHCGTCTRCLAACPTGALIAPLTLDARRCISYLTIEHRGMIPRELRPQMGNRIFGCDDCLEACPWNERAQRAREMRLAARQGRDRVDLLEWLCLLADEAAFKKEFAGTPLLRPKRAGLRRNVCIALGNVGGAESVPGLAEALAGDSAPIVRAHAAWALGQIASRTGNRPAREALRRAAEIEEEDSVSEEIAAALRQAEEEAPAPAARAATAPEPGGRATRSPAP